MPLSEHVYYVAKTFKIAEWVEQWICIKFCGSLNIPPWKLLGWFRRPQLWATGGWQLHHNNMPAYTSRLVRSFLSKHQITPVTQPCHIWDLAPCGIWLFPKTKITFEREETLDHWWDPGKYDRAADGDWENCVRSHGSYCEGDWGIIVLCTMFLVSCVFFNTWFYFSYYMDG